ncbi:MAG: metal ABC transporter ATP-binding protein [Alphaproteobacteria bacterium]
MSTGLITMENLGLTYPGGHVALENINLTLHKGTICGLVGINGAGKSTLFKTIMGFEKPTTGTVRIASYDVKTALKKNLVAYVPQTEDVNWDFPVLVEDVVMMGRYGHMNWLRQAKQSDKNALETALQRVDMLPYRKRQIGELSGGQKKRVFVARALAQEARIILLDEPFTGVDIKTEESLAQLFRNLVQNGALIFVSTHNLGSVPHFCDEVALLNRTILAHGPVETTFSQENLAKTFGGKLRHHQLFGHTLHDDEDARGITVLTDDERPLVLYGEKGGQKIVRMPHQENE